MKESRRVESHLSPLVCGPEVGVGEREDPPLSLILNTWIPYQSGRVLPFGWCKGQTFVLSMDIVSRVRLEWKRGWCPFGLSMHWVLVVGHG